MKVKRIAALAAAFTLIRGAAALGDGIPGHKGTALNGLELGTKSLIRREIN